MTEKEQSAFKSELQKMLKDVRPNVIARTVLADGRYFASKISEEITILKQVDDRWKAVKPAEVVKGDNIVMLSKCEQFKTGYPVSVAVSESFSDFPLRSFFSFEVISGKTKMSLDKLTAKQVEELTK